MNLYEKREIIGLSLFFLEIKSFLWYDRRKIRTNKYEKGMDKKMDQRKKILFITGTRADYGKIKPIMQRMERMQDGYEVFVYVSGMHLLQKYGSTYREVQKDGYRNTYVAFEQVMTDNMSYNLGVVLMNMARYAEKVQPDMIVVHGDRIDALAGAITGALNNILVAHIEGGEISGTIDDSIRHAISKFAHLHFVCNEEARKRLLQMGEQPERVFVIGSPDIDIMLGGNLPSLEQACERYEIEFDPYGIFMYHPVTTEVEELADHIHQVVEALLQSGGNYIVVYPNNDNGTEIVLNEIGRLYGNKHFRIFPSIRFEYFLTFLKNASVIVGNSSAGIRESGIYGIPAIDIGSRQQGRYDMEQLKNIQHAEENVPDILDKLSRIREHRIQAEGFGGGNSTELFFDVLDRQDIWDLDIQKTFVDIRGLRR